MSRGATRRRKRARTPSPLLSLGPDVLGLIVNHLDRASASSFALTCSTIRPIAERAAWKELNISVHRTFMPGSTSWNQYRPLGGNRLFAIREEHIWGTADTSAPSRLPRPDESRSGLEPHTPKPGTESSLARYYFDLIAHLQADPLRLTSVRSIFIDLDRLLHPLFADLLRLVAPTVRHLHFHPPGFPYEPNGAFPSVSLRGIFHIIGPSVTFDNLRTLYLPLADDWGETILTTLRATPRLRTLTIAVEQPYSGSWGATTDFAPFTTPPDGWPVLEDLETLFVEEMAAAFEALVVALMKGSRGVRRVTIRDPAQTWHFEAGNELIDVLASAPGLRYVACPRSAFLKNVKGKYRDVEELAVAEERQPWGLPALEAVSIPPLPRLKALYSYARIDEARSITCAWNGESRGLPPAIRPISPTTLQAIHTASSLLYIQLPGSPTREFGIPATDAEWGYWGSKASAKKHDRAVLIRTYTHEGTGEVFTHCRGYSAHHSHIEDGILHRTEDVWEEYVDYMGVCPPAGVLGEVYLAMDGDAEAGWKVPGRKLRMSEKTWEVLRRWNAKASTAKEPGIIADGVVMGGVS